MKKFLIFLFILMISIFVYSDLKKIITSSATTAYSRTPAQMEIRSPLNRKNVEAKHLNIHENTKNMHDKFRKENEKKQEDNKFNLDMNKKNY